jgi:SAM-dependent methyltransferase
MRTTVGRQLDLNSTPNCIVCGSHRWHNVPSVTLAIRSCFAPAEVVRCQRCGLGRLDPLPNRMAVEAIYSSESYADSYDRVGQSFVVAEETANAQLATRFARLASYLPNKGNLLDIGASRGVFLKQAAIEGWTIFGLEAGIDSIEYAKKKFDISIEHGTLEEALLPQAHYDCVHLSHVLEHLCDPLGSVAKIASCMKPGGVLVVEVPFEFGDLFDRFRELALRRPRQPNEVPSSHLYFFTIATLSTLLSQAGFEILYSATPRRNPSFESALPMGLLFKRMVYRLEQFLKMGPLIEVYARKK